MKIENGNEISLGKIFITSIRAFSRYLHYIQMFIVLNLFFSRSKILCLKAVIKWSFHNVTNYYLVGKLSTSLNLSSYLVSSWSKSLSISGGDSSCSWMLVHALGLMVKEEFKSVMLGGGWRCGELLVSSSTFTVIQRICKSVPPQKHPHWKNTNTQLQYSLYCYSLDW